MEDAWVAEGPAHTVRVNRQALEIVPLQRGEASRSGLTGVIRAKPLLLKTRSLQRGVTHLDADDPQAPFAASNGSIAIGRGAITEYVANAEDGVHLSWSVPSEPKGTGDLVVRLTVSGERYVAATTSGLHFAQDRSMPGLVFGAATWIDAAGVRSAVALSLTSNELELRVPAETLAHSRYPAVLDPTISSEFGVDNPVVALARGNPNPSGVACGPTQCLVTWTSNFTNDLFGARIASDGALLDPVPIPIARTGFATAGVAFDGVDYFVVWAGAGILGARVRASDGVVLDKSTVGIPISTTTSSRSPAVAFDGTNYLVVWDTGLYLPTGRVMGMRVAPDGTLLDGTVASGGFVIADPGTHQNPAVAFDGRNFLVAWEDTTSGEINATRVRAVDHALLDGGSAGGFKIASVGSNPAIAFDGTNFLAAWRTPLGNIGARRIRPFDGALLDGAASTSGIVIGGNAARGPWLAFGAGNYLVQWATAGGAGGPEGIYGERLRASDGSLLIGPSTPPGVLMGLGTLGVAQAGFVGGNFMTSWVSGYHDQYWSGVSTYVRASRVSAAKLAVLDAPGTIVSNSANTEERAAIASNGTSYFVVWTDNRGSLSEADTHIYGSLVRPDGSLVAPAGIPICTVPTGQYSPTVASDGTNFLVLWSDRRALAAGDLRVYGTRVRASDGLLLDGPASAGGVLIRSNTFGASAVTFAAGNYFVVWPDTPSSQGDALAGMRIRAADFAFLDGTTSTGGTTIGTNQGKGLKLVTDGSNFLVVWADLNGNLLGARVRADGVLLDAPPTTGAIALGKGASTGGTFDGTNYFIASSYMSSIHGHRIRPADGALLDGLGGIAIADVPGLYSPPDVSFDGTNELVVWDDPRSLSHTDIYGARVRPADGALLDGPSSSAGFPIEVSEIIARNPRVLSAGGRSLVVYEDVIRDPPFSVAFRMTGRFVGEGISCSSASDCSTGFCVDGACCDSACGGGIATDCLACSAAAGAATDGVCGFVVMPMICRGVAGPCDAPESCGGTSALCPPDGFAATGSVCRSAATLCDEPETCLGGTVTCPADQIAIEGKPCREPANACDLPEVCDGFAKLCPANVYKLNGESCAGGLCVGGECAPQPDAGAPDAGANVDAGSSDAGTNVEAGSSDAGLDATDIDASAVAGGLDANTDPDTGAMEGGSSLLGSGGGGCSCRTTSANRNGQSVALVLPLALMLLARRRLSLRKTPRAHFHVTTTLDAPSPIASERNSFSA